MILFRSMHRYTIGCTVIKAPINARVSPNENKSLEEIPKLKVLKVRKEATNMGSFPFLIVKVTFRF